MQSASHFQRSPIERRRPHNLSTPIVDSEIEALRILADSISDIFWLTDHPLTRVLYVSPSFARISGLPQDSHDRDLGAWRKLVHPEDRPRVDAAFGRLIEAGHFSAEYRIRRPDGEERWISDRAFPVRDAFGQVYRIAGIAQDITDRKRTELALQQSVQQFETLFAMVPVGIAITYGESCDTVRINPAYARMLGVEPDANASLCSPQPFRLLREGVPLELSDLPFERAVADRRTTPPAEYEIQRDDGKVLIVAGSASPLFREDGSIRAIISAFFDITELRAADVQIRHTNEQMRRLVDANLVGIAIAGENCVFEANDLFLEMTGFSRQSLDEGKVDWVAATPPEYFEMEREALEQIRRNGKCTPYEKEYIRHDGTRVPVLIGAALLTLEPQMRCVAFAADLTMQKALQRELETANRLLASSNEELQRFAAVVAHDLQSPMRTVTTSVQMLVRRCQPILDAETAKLASQIVENTSRMSGLVSDLLDYSSLSRGPAPQAKSIDAGVLLDWTLANLQTRIEETGAVVSHDPLPCVAADDQLVRIFQNLIENALKYRRQQTPRVHIWAERAGSDWRFAVLDNGIGFPAQDASRIFNVLTRLHGPSQYGGTGMGLAICRKLVERYGGRIWAESQPGVGSTFYFTIPAADGPCRPDRLS